MSDKKEDYGLLINKDIKLHRSYFKQNEYEKIFLKLSDTNLFNRNEFFISYVSLISISKMSNTDDKKYFEKHHIIPASFYKYENKEIDNSKNNLVKLSYADHMLAHYYLFKCVKNEQLRRKCAKAILFLLDTQSTKFKNTNELDMFITEKFNEIYTNISDISFINLLKEDRCKEASSTTKKLWQDKNYREKMLNYWNEENRKKVGERVKKYYEENQSVSAKKVICIETWQFFNTIKEAEKYYNTDHHISDSCKNVNKTCGGYHWAYADDENGIELRKKFIGQAKKNTASKKVYCVELNKVFSSAEDAARKTKSSSAHIRDCCKGVLKTTHKMHWRYVDE